MRIYAKKVQFFLVNSKKSSTFARFFGTTSCIVPLGRTASGAIVRPKSVAYQTPMGNRAGSIPALGTRKEVNAMIIVPVKEGENIERAIKKFKRKFDKTGVVKELRRRQQFDKPSELKRVKMAHAKYVQSLHAHDDM